MRKNRAISGAPSQMPTASARPKHVDARNAGADVSGLEVRALNHRRPRPSCEKLRENVITTSAALTTPKSFGESSRVRRTSTTTLSTAMAALPHATHIAPLTARSVRPAFRFTRSLLVGGPLRVMSSQ